MTEGAGAGRRSGTSSSVGEGETVKHIIGIDPGLVHTGAVRIIIGKGEIHVSHTVVAGMDAATVAAWAKYHALPVDHIFVEKYDARQHYSTDERMIKGEAAFKRELKQAEFIKNMGSKKIISIQVLNLMGLWNFTTSTHHQDLRSAARIAVLGMLKTPSLNLILADMVRDTLDGSPWTVVDLGGGVTVASVDD